MQHFVLWEKKICLVNRVGWGEIEFWPRNVEWREEGDLPKCLFDQPLLRGIFRDLGGRDELSYTGKAFLVPLQAVVDLLSFAYIVYS